MEQVSTAAKVPGYSDNGRVDIGASLDGRIDPGAELAPRDRGRVCDMLEDAACGLDTLILLLDGFHYEVDLPNGCQWTPSFTS